MTRTSHCPAGRPLVAPPPMTRTSRRPAGRPLAALLPMTRTSQHPAGRPLVALLPMTRTSHHPAGRPLVALLPMTRTSHRPAGRPLVAPTRRDGVAPRPTTSQNPGLTTSLTSRPLVATLLSSAVGQGGGCHPMCLKHSSLAVGTAPTASRGRCPGSRQASRRASQKYGKLCMWPHSRPSQKKARSG